MAGNKTITGIAFAAIIALVLSACMFHPPGYGGLYVNNSVSVSDTTDIGKAPPNMVDTSMNHLIDTTSDMEAEMPFFLQPAEELYKISSDSVYQQDVEQALEAITDSIQLLRYQMIELQKQLTVIPDSSFTGEKSQEFQPSDSLQTEVDFKQQIQVKDDSIAIMRNQMTELKRTADLEGDTVYIIKEEVNLLKEDSTQTDLVTNQMLQDKNDTVNPLRNQASILNRSIDLKPDTEYISQKLQQLKGDSYQTDYETTRTLQAKNDTIAAISKKLNELQKSGIINSDTVYVVRETLNSPDADSQQTDDQNWQLLRAKDEQIQRMQNQLSSMQNAASRTPQPIYIPRVQSEAQAQPFSSQQTDQLSLQLFQAQSDTLQLLKSQLRSIQLQASERDTVYIEKEATEMQTTLVSEPKTTDPLLELQDTLRLLRTRVLSLEENSLQGQDTSALVNQIKKNAPNVAITDTTLIVAFYERGGLKPLEEDTILKQIKELSSIKNVTNLTLSGYTDSSGSEIVNKNYPYG
jgi:hypothetical protein